MNNTKVISNTIGYTTWQDYLTLCKPKVVLMLLVTALIGMQLARAMPPFVTVIWASIGITFAASAAAVINHMLDIQLDNKMQRTKHRPLVNGRISQSKAFLFSSTLLVLSMAILIVKINWLTAILTLFGFVGYAGFYTIYLKYRTPQNIVYGGIAGALPPLLGWTSVTGSIELGGVILSLIIFLWTPAHFWPLAIDRIEDYRAARVPMLPVVKGKAYTKNAILVYLLLTIFASLLPYFIGMASHYYLVASSFLALWFLIYGIRLKLDVEEKIAIKTFFVSIYYLLGIFVALLIDSLLVK